MRVQDQPVPMRRAWRSGWIGLGVLAVAGVMALLLPLNAVVREGGPLETLHLLCWCAASVAAFVLAGLGGLPARERVLRCWLGLLALLAAARELDLHEKLNPERGPLGDWGVRYRLDWWLDPAMPLGAKLVWAVIGVMLAAVLIAPPLWARPRWPRLMLRGHAAYWLMAMGTGLVVAGYVADDFLGRGQFVSVDTSQLVEELLESAGVGLVLAGVVAVGRAWLTAEPARVPERSAE